MTKYGLPSPSPLWGGPGWGSHEPKFSAYHLHPMLEAATFSYEASLSFLVAFTSSAALASPAAA